MGREWDDRLTRRLAISIMLASEVPRVGKMLVTDLETSELCLVEVLSLDETQVVCQFMVRLARKLGVMRYREEITLAAPLVFT